MGAFNRKRDKKNFAKVKKPVKIYFCVGVDCVGQKVYHVHVL